jgi:anaerobic dimethyl sulfoxide reductase subunit C (anchor subunit)/Tat-targeted selenate reductase subunit YnfH
MGVFEHAASELPLALFSTLAPLGAGAFILLAIAFFTRDFNAQQFKRIDILTGVPLLVVLGGFAAAFAHLQTPTNAFFVLGGIGRSPLSNEILCGMVFLMTAGSYWLVALTGRLTLDIRRVWVSLAALTALCFAITIGVAYAVKTIPSWDTPLSPVALVGFSLLGGVALGRVVLQGARFEGSDSATAASVVVPTSVLVAAPVAVTVAASTAIPPTVSASAPAPPPTDSATVPNGTPSGVLFRNAALVLTVTGALMALAGAGGQLLLVNTLSGIMVSGSAIVSEVMPGFIIFMAGIVITCVLVIRAIFRPCSGGILAGAVIIVATTVFVGRLMFYALQVPVGL